MFISNGCDDCNKYARLEMKNIDQDLLPWLEDVIDENVSTEVLCKICNVLSCQIEDIMELVETEDCKSVKK